MAAWFGADLSNHRVAGPAHEWKFSCRDASMMQVPTIPQSFVFLCLSILGLSSARLMPRTYLGVTPEEDTKQFLIVSNRIVLLKSEPIWGVGG